MEQSNVLSFDQPLLIDAWNARKRAQRQRAYGGLLVSITHTSFDKAVALNGVNRDVNRPPSR